MPLCGSLCQELAEYAVHGFLGSLGVSLGSGVLLEEKHERVVSLEMLFFEQLSTHLGKTLQKLRGHFDDDRELKIAEQFACLFCRKILRDLRSFQQFRKFGLNFSIVFHGSIIRSSEQMREHSLRRSCERRMPPRHRTQDLEQGPRWRQKL